MAAGAGETVDGPVAPTPGTPRSTLGVEPVPESASAGGAAPVSVGPPMVPASTDGDAGDEDPPVVSDESSGALKTTRSVGPAGRMATATSWSLTRSATANL
jgi:hypothetical protein